MSDTPEAPDVREASDERERFIRESYRNIRVLPDDVHFLLGLLDTERATVASVRADRDAIDARWLEWQRAGGGWITERANLLAECARLRDLLETHEPHGHNVTNEQYVKLRGDNEHLRASEARLLEALQLALTELEHPMTNAGTRAEVAYSVRAAIAAASSAPPEGGT